MKKLPTQVIEVENEGLVSLLGQQVTVFCLNYFYTGELEGVNEKVIKLKNPAIVYETGPFDEKKFQNAQKLPTSSLYVNINMIESFSVMDKKV